MLLFFFIRVAQKDVVTRGKKCFPFKCRFENCRCEWCESLGKKMRYTQTHLIHNGIKKNEETIDMSIRPSNWIVCSSLLENQHVLMSIGAAIVCHKIENNCWMFKMLLPTVRIHCRTQTIWNMERFLMKPDNNFFGNFNFPKIFVVIYSNRQETFQYTHTESYPGLMALLFELLSMHWNIFQQLIEQSTFPLRQKCVSKVFMRWWCASVSVEL